MKFPYTGWVLTPSFTPKQVVFKEDANSWFGDWHITEKGKRYATESIHATKQSAITAGHQSLDKKQALINKRRATLEKASQ